MRVCSGGGIEPSAESCFENGEFDASVANGLFSWLAPAGLAGEPASVYVMSRRGVPLDSALAITFAKFATSFALIYGTDTVWDGATAVASVRTRT